LDEAETHYEDMNGKYGVSPELQHYACMIVACGCLGHFKKATSLINMMPSLDDPSVWLTLLCTCRKWENVKLGRLAFDQIIQLDRNLGAAYVLMANIYKDADMHADAREVEAMSPACQKHQGISHFNV
jgi:pentatricopeptide repeat protein